MVLDSDLPPPLLLAKPALYRGSAAGDWLTRRTVAGWALRGEAGDASEEELDARDVAWVPLSAVLAVDDTWQHLIASPPGSAFARNPKTWKFEAVDADTA